MALSFPTVSGAWTSRGPPTHRVRSVVSDEFAVLDHRGTTKSAVADAAISEWLAKRNY
jgi:hypothetical protein